MPQDETATEKKSTGIDLFLPTRIPSNTAKPNPPGCLHQLQACFTRLLAFGKTLSFLLSLFESLLNIECSTKVEVINRSAAHIAKRD